MDDKKVHVLAKLFGGQGTINVPSWSPDSKKLAFVSYELLPEDSVISKSKIPSEFEEAIFMVLRLQRCSSPRHSYSPRALWDRNVADKK